MINIVPSDLTIDNKPKIIVDPYYYKLIVNEPEWKRFMEQQSMSDEDIVTVDKRELYLNLPNFSVLPDLRGQNRILFNKNKGYTASRLKFKDGIAVQPEMEIIAMASFLGSLRCATNMLPRSLVKKCPAATIKTPDNLPTGKAGEIIGFLQSDAAMLQNLSELFVSTLIIQIRDNGSPWEFEEFTRSAYLYLSSDQLFNSETWSNVLKQALRGLIEELSRWLGPLAGNAC